MKIDEMKTICNPVLIDHISVIGDGEFIVPEGSYESLANKGPNNLMQWKKLDSPKVSKKYTHYAIKSELYDAKERRPVQKAS
jgi:hypothetical protein